MKMKFEFVEWQCIDGFMVPGTWPSCTSVITSNKNVRLASLRRNFVPRNR